MGRTRDTEDQHGRKLHASGSIRGKDHFACCLRRDPPFHDCLLRCERTTISRTNSAASNPRLPGDLHLDHVHITPEAITIFDCIEFNDRFRFIDIANDLAFLAMDFDFEGKHQLSELFLQNAAREFGDSGLLKLANFYKCYRAFVRGKVESIETNSTEPTACGRTCSASNALFSACPALCNRRLAAFRFRSHGRVGTGKSTVARQLGSELGWPVFSSDRIRKTLAGVPLTKRTPQKSAEVYSPQMTHGLTGNSLKTASPLLAVAGIVDPGQK